MVEIKVLIKEKIAEAGVKKLKDAGFEVDFGLDMKPEKLAKRIKDYDGLIIRSGTQVTKEIIDKAKKLKIIGRAGIGVDNVDVDAATQRGIIVANAPQSNIVSAAEHTIALLLAQCRNVPQASASLKLGKWERSRFQGVEVRDKVLGIVGLGRVGTLVAQQAQGLGMQVIAYDPYVSKDRFEQLGVKGVDKLEDLLKAADFVSVHLPKTKETVGMFGDKEFGLMKEGVRLINTARGGIFQEKALIKALKSGKVASVGIDVYEKEPCTSSALFKFAQAVVTPHLGASTQEAQDKAGVDIAEQVIAALEGGVVTNAVNIEAGAVEEALMPFVPLVEKLGWLMSNIIEGSVSDLEIEYAGELAAYDPSILTVAFLKGLFSAVVLEPVTYVNAPIIAQERGIHIKETKTNRSKDYVNVISAKATTSGGKEVSVAGTLVGKKKKERFVNIFDFDIDMLPSKYMAFFAYEDRPGMIGKVGTILGKNNVNIANMQVGRRVVKGEALMGLNVDTSIPEEVMKEILDQSGITYGRFMVLY